MTKIILTKEKCAELALLCNTKKEFNENFSGAYNKALKNGWSEEICSHMVSFGNYYKRCLYVYKFKDSHIYIGLTYNLEERDKRHKKDTKSSVFKYAKQVGYFPKIEKLTDYLDKDKISKKEIELIREFRNKGWIMLNKHKGGGLGGNIIKWTKDECVKVALKCKSKKDFIVKYPGARAAALKNGWLDEIHKQFPEIIKTKNYWTKERCASEALKYKNKNDFRKGNISAYNVSNRNGWMEEICIHMKQIGTQKGYWTKERCKEEALKYPTKTQFHKAQEGAYKAARKNGWLDEFFSL